MLTNQNKPQQILTKLELSGFKTIRNLSDKFSFGQINVLVGANGAGKSNFISFFKMLSWMTGSDFGLGEFVARSGGANSLLHDGARVTPIMEASLTVKTGSGLNDYYISLVHAAKDTFIFRDEKYRFSDSKRPNIAKWIELGAGHKECKLRQEARIDKTAKTILGLLQKLVVYQFHNTSETARVRQKWDISNNKFLLEDAANLAPFLLRLQKYEPKAYRRIVETIRQMAPFFDDFVFEPDYNQVLLQWRERNTEKDLVFAAHQASDGMLRVIALVTLLLQPTNSLPAVIILDEPELGLHPYAISVIAGLLKSISLHAQVIIATQSMTLLDYFEPDEVIVVDRVERESVFRRLNSEKLKDWLEEYSLAELLEKNVIGGNPHR
jgi:predicted ATPase